MNRVRLAKKPEVPNCSTMTARDYVDFLEKGL